MKKVFYLLSLLVVGSGYSLQAQNSESDSILKQYNLEEVVIQVNRVKEGYPAPFSEVGSEDIKRNNAGKNAPYLLQTLPSVVAYSEGGTAIGNTSFRIRGTDANRINITLNGMPLNNPESQEVYWVNIPDLSNSLQSIQVQRGVGTATNGTASFGGSISLKTTGIREAAYGEASTAVGSYNAFLSTIAAGTGTLDNGISVDGRYSRSTGDGYIRNGKVDHKSGYLSVTHKQDNQLLKLIYINGIQHTGITWEGVAPEMMAIDRRYNDTGQYVDEAGNIRYYDNDTDNYYSNIAQLLFSRFLGNSLTLNTGFSYNNGYGYYENYKVGQNLNSKFGLQPQVVDGVTYKKSDVIRRKLMSNDLYSLSANLNYAKDRWNVTAGGVYTHFGGSHFGRLPWIKYNENTTDNYQWYESNSTKKDVNIFVKTEYQLTNQLSLFGELQNRYVDFRMEGIDDDLTDITSNHYYNFFNPRAGVSYKLGDNSLYASVGVSNREPLRADLKEYVKGVSGGELISEQLTDYELGYKYTNSTFAWGANLYYMDYKDQLVLTGKLSDVGYKLQENVSDSYRVGVELEAAWSPLNWLRFDANTTMSRNKIKDYTMYYTVYDNPNDWNFVGTEKVTMKSTDISFSPNLVGSGIVTVTPVKNLRFSLANKYVGKMYYNNTSDKRYQLDDYLVSDFSTGYTFKAQKIGEIDIDLFVNNIWNKKYIANGITDVSTFQDGSPDDVYHRVFPQAPRNFMARVGIRF